MGCVDSIWDGVAAGAVGAGAIYEKGGVGHGVHFGGDGEGCASGGGDGVVLVVRIVLVAVVMVLCLW